MRIFIAGMDGYLGWSLAKHLTRRGHEVAGGDNFFRRRWVEEMNSTSAIPIATMPDRLAGFTQQFGTSIQFWEGDLCNYDFIEKIFREFRPEAVVHLGECPSAPYSMIDVHHATFVQMNNLTSTFNLIFAIKDICPDAHLLKLGTMGEYGTPKIDIPEGFFEIEFRGRKDRLPFPRQAGSWYHQSKVHGSNNVLMATKVYGLAATDIMQGVVFGTRVDHVQEEERRLWGRLDFDQAFGTAVNRFCCQAVIGHPLTLFGKGHQKRGFLPLCDSMQCLTLALENPPKRGEFRIFNQFQEVYDLTELAHKVQRAARRVGIETEISHFNNPRVELDEHYYNPDHQHLLDLGYQPTRDVEAEIEVMIRDLSAHRERIAAKRDVLVPDLHWDGKRKKIESLDSARAEQLVGAE